ncbi:lytic murein transglycosylase, partial [Enterobacter cloacae]
GAKLYQANQQTLAQISNQYGVPANYIVALWGLESGFGRVQGKEDVISALATLAFEGRREALFSRQLMAA